MKRQDSYRMAMVRLACIMGVLILLASEEYGKADFTFGTPTNLGPTVNSSSGDSVTCFSSDGLEMYLDSDRPGGSGNWDIWVAKRPTKNDDWGTPVNLGPIVNSSYMDGFSHISADGLELYFESKRPGGVGGGDIWVAKRATRDDAWGMPVNLGTPVNTSGSDSTPRLSTDGLELYYCSSRGYGAHDIWVCRRTTTDDPWEPPVNLGAMVNSSADEFFPFVSTDGLTLFFSGNRGQPLRPGGFGGADMWVTTRASVSEPWRTPVNLGSTVNSPSYDCGPVISPDGSMLYFCSERPGGFGGPYGDIYQAPIVPIVDFNGDEKVDGVEICMTADRWGTDDPVCDIGPMPWGDGVVDVEDLKVLAESIGRNVDDPTLIAHWAFDETDGDIACDSEGVHDGTVTGTALWHPDAGQTDGALELDGVTFIVADRVLNPSDGPFSVLAWVQGGAPGQAIISQQGGVNWLMLDPATGALRTELGSSGRTATVLYSDAIMSDDAWHRVSFTWDGASRRLYVDDVLTAEDTQHGLAPSFGSVVIGTAKDMAPGTFWTGLIDDVRIYSRAVRP